MVSNLVLLEMYKILTHFLYCSMQFIIPLTAHSEPVLTSMKGLQEACVVMLFWTVLFHYAWYTYIYCSIHRRRQLHCDIDTLLWVSLGWIDSSRNQTHNGNRLLGWRIMPRLSREIIGTRIPLRTCFATDRSSCIDVACYVRTIPRIMSTLLSQVGNIILILCV